MPPSPAVVRVLAPALLVATTVALAITRTEDYDAWTHLALGRDLVQRGGFPTHEPLSFPGAHLGYYNVEWLFDVLFYLAHAGAGFVGVAGLKAGILALAFWIFWLDSRPAESAAPQTTRHHLVRLAVLLPTLLVVRHRFVERPDIVLMVFLGFTVYALNAYVGAGRRMIFLLPPVYLVWANMHPSLVVGLVPFAAVLGGGLALRLFAHWRGQAPPGTPSWRQLGVVSAVLAAALAASLANPYGADALLLPFQLAENQWFRHEVFELRRPTFAEWPAPYVYVGLLAVTFAVLARRLPLIPILLVLPFIHLGFSAVRFVFLLAIVAAPVLARQLNAIADVAPGVAGRRLTSGGAAAAAAAGAAAIAFALGQVGGFADPRKVTGVGVNERYVPEAALRYLDRHGVEGRVFNVFHWGGYIAWRDLPRRMPILDGRGQMEPMLLEEIHFARVYPQHLERPAAAYGIDIAVVDYPSYSGDPVEQLIGPDADAALASPAWALVYWDDQALVYLRRGGRHAALIARDEYRHVKPANGAAGIARVMADTTRAAAARAELERNQAATGSSLSWLLLGYAAARPEDAVTAFARVRHPERLFEAHQASARAHWQRKDFAAAARDYERALAIQEAATLLYDAALVQAEAGDDRAAIRYLRRAQRADPDLAHVYPALLAAYRRIGDEGSAQALGPDFLRAATRARVAQHVRAAFEGQAAGRMDAADEELADALKLDPRSPAALSALGYLRFAQGRLDAAAQAQQAALAADPRLARAHYNLAQIAGARGDATARRAHLEAFVTLAPRAYEAWQARQELARAGRS